MKFIYLGPAQETDAFGQVFPKGAAVEVTDENAIKKLAGNPCFKAGKEAKEK